VTYDPAAMVKRSRAVSKRLNDGVGFLMKKNKVTVIWGEAVIDAPGKITVKAGKSEAPKGALGAGSYQAKHRTFRSRRQTSFRRTWPLHAGCPNVAASRRVHTEAGRSALASRHLCMSRVARSPRRREPSVPILRRVPPNTKSIVVGDLIMTNHRVENGRRKFHPRFVPTSLCLVNCFYNTDIGGKFLPSGGKRRNRHSSDYGDFRFWPKIAL
jgi:hypothetical protein